MFKGKCGTIIGGKYFHSESMKNLFEAVCNSEFKKVYDEQNEKYINYITFRIGSTTSIIIKDGIYFYNIHISNCSDEFTFDTLKTLVKNIESEYDKRREEWKNFIKNTVLPNYPERLVNQDCKEVKGLLSLNRVYDEDLGYAEYICVYDDEQYKMIYTKGKNLCAIVELGNIKDKQLLRSTFHLIKDTAITQPVFHVEDVLLDSLYLVASDILKRGEDSPYSTVLEKYATKAIKEHDEKMGITD